MPHITVEYSANIAPRADVRALIRAIHRAALTSSVFEVAAVRTRAEPRDLYEIADGNSDNAFVAICVRMAVGRDPEQRQQLSQRLLDAALTELQHAYDTTPLAISVELQEINPVGALRKNNLHQRRGSDLP